NIEVIKTVTIPNVLLNFDDRESVLKRCQFFCGDWGSFTKLLIASKSYYFGVGGGIKQFQNLIEEDGIFDVETVWKNRE
ncbi:unnamed protein product, partial [Heterotrigona itama]